MTFKLSPFVIPARRQRIFLRLISLMFLIIAALSAERLRNFFRAIKKAIDISADDLLCPLLGQS
jgi:hypothetical protein